MTLNFIFFTSKMWIIMCRHKVVVRIKWGMKYKAPPYLACRRQSTNIVIFNCFIFVVLLIHIFVPLHAENSPCWIHKWIQTSTINLNYLENTFHIKYILSSSLALSSPFPPISFITSPFSPLYVYRCVKGKRKTENETKHAHMPLLLLFIVSLDLDRFLE